MSDSATDTAASEVAPVPAVGTCRLLIVVSLALSFARLMQAQPLQSANDRSRWCTVRALVEQGTYRIDDARRVPGWDTIDLVKHEGHFYSTKPPLLATLVAGLYALIRATLGWTLGRDLLAVTRLILGLVNLLPMAAALVLLLRIVRRASSSHFAVVLTALAACFGTLLLPFLTTFNNHVPAAVSVVFALAAAVPLMVDGRRDAWRFAMAGFWSGFAFTNELPAAAFVAALAALLARVSTRATLLWFTPAAAVPIAAFVVTNWLVTDGPMPFYTEYGSEKYRFVHEGVPSYWMHPRGIDKGTDSVATYFLHCTIGHHGLLSLTPIYVLTLIGWARAGRQLAGRFHNPDASEPAPATFAVLQAAGAALTLIVFAFFLTRTANYNYGGVSVALRWMLWLVPFWLLAIPAAVGNWCRRWWGRSLAGLALAASVFSAWYPFDGPWKHPWLFTVMSDAGWIDYGDPQPQFNRPVRTWIYRLPSGRQRDPDYWIELTGRDVDGIPLSVRIADGGPSNLDDVPVRIVEITETRQGTSTLSRYAVDPAAFEAGADPDAFLQWSTSSTAAQRQAAVHFWRGLPRAAPYRAAAERYVRLPIRTEAFHCIQAAAQVALRSEATGETTWHRRDAWTCDELPFGVAQIDTQVQDASRQVIARQRLTATACGRTW